MAQAPQQVVIPNMSTNIDAINASGTPINPTNSSALAAYGAGMPLVGADFDSYKDFVMQQTDRNNAWSAQQAANQNAFQERMNQIAMEFNAAEAAKNRDWQEMMSNTAHQREVKDLQAAGLNPILSASGGNGAAVTSGATASGVTSSGAKGETDTSANAAMAAFYSSLISAQQQMYNANLSAKTNLAIADKQLANNLMIAQMQNGLGYAQLSNQRYMAEHYPNTLVGAGNQLLNYILGGNWQDTRTGSSNEINIPDTSAVVASAKNAMNKTSIGNIANGILQGFANLTKKYSYKNFVK